MVPIKYFNVLCGGFMKMLLSVFTIFCLFFFNSCKSDSAGGSDGFGFGPGGGGGGGVTFGITQANGNTGIIFYATPSAAVTITKVNVSVPNSNPPFNEDYTDPGTTVYPANVAVTINEFTGVQSGQKWVFTFTGKLGSATGAAFTVTSNYTVP
jgi:hypothetical protein